MNSEETIEPEDDVLRELKGKSKAAEKRFATQRQHALMAAGLGLMLLVAFMLFVVEGSMAGYAAGLANKVGGTAFGHAARLGDAFNPVAGIASALALTFTGCDDARATWMRRDPCLGWSRGGERGWERRAV